MKLLSLSCVYPNPAEPGYGTFVRERIRAMAKCVDLRVMAPVAFGRNAAHSASLECDGPIQVLHPRWLYPPGAGWLNPLCLAAALAGPLRRCRREFRFHWIDAHFGYPTGVAAVLLAGQFGVPAAITLRGSEVEHARDPLQRGWMRWALRRASAVIAVAENLRQFAEGLGVHGSRLTTISNGVDQTIFHPRDRMACRQRHGIPADAQVILSAGHLIELKGHHRIAAALPLGAHLIIAGNAGRGASYETQIRGAAARAGAADRVRLTGSLPPEPLAELMCAADVLCLASSREGCPNVVVEALACGTPVVASDVGGVSDLIPSARYGLVIPAGDDRALEHALVTALNHTWSHDAIAAWGATRSWETTGRRVVEFLKRTAPPEML